MTRGLDVLDDLEVDAAAATERAKRLAARLRDAGVTVVSVEDATLEADASVNLEGGRHVQVGVDGTYCVVEERGESFSFSPATRSAARIVRELTAAGGEARQP